MSQPKQTKGTISIGRRRRGVIFLSRASTLSVIFSGLATALLIFSLTAAGIPILPMIWYQLQPGTSSALAKVLKKPVTGFDETLLREGIRDLYQPPINLELSPENRIAIESIGVDTLIVEEVPEKYEEAFRKGVWRVPDFGTAYERKYPMILAAHRFGYLKWTNNYRKKNSFFNLNKVKEGDIIEIIWERRKYTYEVFKGDEGEEITDYTADLILYTCKFLESDIRIFRYARLLEI